MVRADSSREKEEEEEEERKAGEEVWAQAMVRANSSEEDKEEEDAGEEVLALVGVLGGDLLKLLTGPK